MRNQAGTAKLGSFITVISLMPKPVPLLMTQNLGFQFLSHTREPTLFMTCRQILLFYKPKNPVSLQQKAAKSAN